ncbi:helix-turn-helix transcriptional regulator [uncultured Muribaculum sp.]|uniref:helix-turn-helix transcriptional regulator n=1 Tax=uncultured Muribaculum sp. TaxID=1918613 RepID=UPI002625D99A|nr:helix-turn-helix transcriptional regulator [uncultured Muribaculum sp.]
MSLVKADTNLSSIIDKDPSVIPVLNRFGIRLGTGDITIEDACRVKKQNTEFILAILNTFINEAYFPEDKFRSFESGEIADYLFQTNGYYRHFQLPNIERHFKLLIQSAAADSNIYLLLEFFQELRESILKRVEYDNALVIPALKGGEPDASLNAVIKKMELSDIGIADRLSDLKNMFVRHLRGIYDDNLLYAVILAIITLEKDMRQNNRIRARLLYPLLMSMANNV